MTVILLLSLLLVVFVIAALLLSEQPVNAIIKSNITRVKRYFFCRIPVLITSFDMNYVAASIGINPFTTLLSVVLLEINFEWIWKVLSMFASVKTSVGFPIASKT